MFRGPKECLLPQELAARCQPSMAAVTDAEVPTGSSTPGKGEKELAADTVQASRSPTGSSSHPRALLQCWPRGQGLQHRLSPQTRSWADKEHL